MRTSPLAVTTSALLSYVTWSALKVTTWSSPAGALAAGAGTAVDWPIAAAGTVTSMGSADHQTNFARNSVRPLLQLPLQEEPIPPRTHGDNRPRRATSHSLPRLDRHPKGCPNRA